jgi:ankyrin repeat protein
VVQLLLDNGADVHAEDGKHGNALQAASAKGNTRVVQLLLDKGTDVHAEGGEYGNVLKLLQSEATDE